jgi:hypothetical protein
MKRIQSAFSHFPVTLLLGPRQCGKTTAARDFFEAHGGTYFDLEDPDTPLKPDIAKLVLNDLKGLIVIDEFQRQPELFPLLRVLADRTPNPGRFLVLGSASIELVRGISESLAGRVSYVDMSGFGIHEIDGSSLDRLWIRGGFPRSFLAEDEDLSYEWRSNFIQSFLERDIPQLGIRIPAQALRRFWVMASHQHGQVWNAADYARSMGTKEDTVRRYLDILTGAFMIRQLPPWFENTGKRVVKAPKMFVRDSGILHTLLGIRDKMQLHAHPRLGFSWEGFAMEQIILLTGIDTEAYFYKTHGGAELDLFFIKKGKRYGFEFKYSDAPGPTKAMHVVINDLGLERLWVVYPGNRAYPLADNIEVMPLSASRERLKEAGLLR